MTDREPLARLMDELETRHAAGRPARFWLRDDDATRPTPALERLLATCERHAVPLTLAVIPRDTGPALADRLGRSFLVDVAVHGWSHTNHAGPGEKTCELGLHRGREAVLADLRAALARGVAVHGDLAVPVLVPPWNRIDPALLPDLPGLGYRALSVFGAETDDGLIARINTHVDLIDWRGNRGGRAPGALVDDILARLRAIGDGDGVVGILGHHLVHDEAAWIFLDRLIELTATHPACRWQSLSDLVAAPRPSSQTDTS